MSTVKLDGPRLAPASGGPAKQLVVFLHGYGADGNDLIALGNQWQALLPDAAFVSPHAPDACAGAPTGRQWFSITVRNPGEFWTGVKSAAPILNEFLDTELAALGLDGSRLALVGFSQGTMMSLHVGLRRNTSPACILGYSGMLAGEAYLKDEITVRPPVMLIHGDQDEMIPVQALHAARQALADTNVNVQWHISQGIGHGIDGEGLALGGRFVANALTQVMTKAGNVD